MTRAGSIEWHKFHPDLKKVGDFICDREVENITVYFGERKRMYFAEQKNTGSRVLVDIAISKP